jgi:hypothetical protein
MNDDKRLALSHLAAPKLDDTSREIFMASSLFNMLYLSAECSDHAQLPVHSHGQHRDVTGFYQRKSGRRKSER